jgi:hypothetical protein
MHTGCFSWCPLRLRWGSKKQRMTETKPLEVSINLHRAISLTDRCVQKSLENPPGITAETTFGKPKFMERTSDEVKGSVDVLRIL